MLSSLLELVLGRTGSNEIILGKHWSLFHFHYDSNQGIKQALGYYSQWPGTFLLFPSTSYSPTSISLGRVFSPPISSPSQGHISMN